MALRHLTGRPMPSAPVLIERDIILAKIPNDAAPGAKVRTCLVMGVVRRKGQLQGYLVVFGQSEGDKNQPRATRSRRTFAPM